MKKVVLATLAAGIWMNASEFIQNELLLKNKWISGFESLGLTFETNRLGAKIEIIHKNNTIMFRPII